MSLPVPNDHKRLNKVTHAVRAAQAVLQYGPGAMVDFPDQTLMTAAPKYWETRINKIYDERLAKALNVQFFGVPGGSDEFKDGISYTRFPEWYFCPKCRRFMPISEWIKEFRIKNAGKKVLDDDPHMTYHMKCPKCFQDLVVARIVTVCEHGHISDFPWVKWTHANNLLTGGAKEVCAHPNLTFKTGSSASEGLEGLVIKCENCQARATLKGAFDKDAFAGLDKANGTSDFFCVGSHPWKHTVEKCSLYPRAMQRGSSSVYFPVSVSSLVIPPYSDRINGKIENSITYNDCLIKISDYDADEKETKIRARLDMWVHDIAIEIGENEVHIKNLLVRKWLEEIGEDDGITGLKYRIDEYEALNGTVSSAAYDEGDFLREGMCADEYAIPYIKHISLIHKVKEVRALTGFSRINPVPADNDDSEYFVSIKESGDNWYPAYEVRGEGVYFELDSSAIQRWADDNPQIVERAKILSQNFNDSFFGKNNHRNITSKFILLHTLSHLLIKQLSFECGYSIASLRERIYASNECDGKDMSGILIYTASGDAEGTLGGLVRQGRSDSFPRIFRKAVETAMACSNDPVCSLSHGQGRDSLNMAACHACTLIPETSCEEMNTFLDRGTVIGTFESPEIGLFNSWINQM